MLLSKCLGVQFPPKIQKTIYIGQVLPNSYSLLLRSLSVEYSGLLVVLVEDFNIAYQLEAELLNSGLGIEQNMQILHFPDWGTLPYDHFSPHPEIISESLS